MIASDANVMKAYGGKIVVCILMDDWCDEFYLDDVSADEQDFYDHYDVTLLEE